MERSPAILQICVVLACVVLAFALTHCQRGNWFKLTSERLFWSYAVSGLTLLLIAIAGTIWKFGYGLFPLYWPPTWDASYPELIGLGGIGLGLIGVADTFALDAEKTRHERYISETEKRKMARAAAKTRRSGSLPNIPDA